MHRYAATNFINYQFQLNELHFLMESHTAEDAQKAGLVTKILKDQNFVEDVIILMRNISSSSNKV